MTHTYEPDGPQTIALLTAERDTLRRKLSHYLHKSISAGWLLGEFLKHYATMEESLIKVQAGEWIEGSKDVFGLKNWGIAIVAKQMGEMFKERNLQHFIELHLENDEIGPLTLTLQRRLGKTPGTLAREFKEEVDRLQLRIDELEGAAKL